MLVKSTAPSRISLFGGGTDLEIYSKDHGGIVVSLAIDLYQTTTFYTGDNVFGLTNNTFPINANPKFYYQLLDEFGLNGMHHSKHESIFDGVIESGIGSSGAATVAFLGAINKAFDLKIDNIPEKAYELESKYQITGRQDHYASYYGGVNVFEFKDSVNVTPLSKGFIEKLYPHLVLVHTNIKRKSNPQKGFSELTQDQIESLNSIKELAVASIDPIAQGEYQTVGELLKVGWDLKKKSNKVTSSDIDAVYEWSLKNGAYGGKLLGSGGGGYMLFVVEDKKDFIKKISDKGPSAVDFNIDWNGLLVREL